MDSSRTVYAAGCIVYCFIKGEPNYVLIRSVKGHWDFPKGKQEAGETLEETAVREVCEEIGILVQCETQWSHTMNYSFSEDGELINKMLTMFLAVSQPEPGAVKLSDEHHEYQWVSYSQAHALLSHKQQKNMLSQAHLYLTKK